MTRLSNKHSHLFKRKNGKQFVMGIVIERAVKCSGVQNTTLICVTSRMIWVYLNFKQHFDNLSYRLCL